MPKPPKPPTKPQEPPILPTAYSGSANEFRFATGVSVLAGPQGPADPFVYLDFWQGSPDATTGQGIARLVVSRALADVLADQLDAVAERI